MSYKNNKHNKDRLITVGKLPVNKFSGDERSGNIDIQPLKSLGINDIAASKGVNIGQPTSLAPSSSPTPTKSPKAGFDVSQVGGLVENAAGGISGMISSIQGGEAKAKADAAIEGVKGQQMGEQSADDSFDAIMEDAGNMADIANADKKDFGFKSVGEVITGTLSDAGQGAAAGAAAGPWGALAGAIVGTATGLTRGLMDRKHAREQAERVNEEIAYTNDFNDRAMDNRIENVKAKQAANLMANFAAEGGGIHIKKANRGKFTEYCGGNVTNECIQRGLHSDSPTIRKRANFARNARGWKHEDGGALFTNGAMFPTGLTVINEGGSHEANPYGGVPMGADSQGVPNLVEEGETIFNDYVFSNRLHIPKAIRNKYKMRDKKPITFAEASKRLAKEIEEMPNDPIAIRGLKAYMGDLAEAQEGIRANIEKRKQNRTNKFDDGGPFNPLFPSPADLLDDDIFNQLLNIQGIAPGNSENAVRIEGQNGFNPITSYLPMSASWINPNDSQYGNKPISKNIYTVKLGPKGFINIDDDKKHSTDIPTLDRDNLGLNFEQPSDIIRKPKTNGEVSTTKEKLKGTPTWLRYASAVGPLLGLLHDVSQKDDYSNAERVERAGDINIPEVSFNPIGNYLAYKPFDTDYNINKLNANAAASRRALLNNAAGNKGMGAASILASDFNTINQLGDLQRKAAEYNLEQRQRVEDFNRNTNLANSEGKLKADTANQRAKMALAESKLRAAIYGAQMRDAIAARKGASISQNLLSLFDNLGNIGKDFMTNDQKEFAVKTDSFGDIDPEIYERYLSLAGPKKTVTKKVKKGK